MPDKTGLAMGESIAKKCDRETNLISERHIREDFVSDRKNMPTTRCLCGFKILLVPDSKAMDRAIKNHLVEHKKTRVRSHKDDLLEKFLTEQTLIEASKIDQQP